MFPIGHFYVLIYRLCLKACAKCSLAITRRARYQRLWRVNTLRMHSNKGDMQFFFIPQGW